MQVIHLLHVDPVTGNEEINICIAIFDCVVIARTGTDSFQTAEIIAGSVKQSTHPFVYHRSVIHGLVVVKQSILAKRQRNAIEQNFSVPVNTQPGSLSSFRSQVSSCIDIHMQVDQIINIPKIVGVCRITGKGTIFTVDVDN